MKLFITILLLFSLNIYSLGLDNIDCCSKPCVESLGNYNFKLLSGFTKERDYSINPEINIIVKKIFSIGIDYINFKQREDIINGFGLNISALGMGLDFGVSIKYLIDNQVIDYSYFLAIPALVIDNENKGLMVGLYYKFGYNTTFYNQFGIYFLFADKGLNNVSTNK